MRRPGSRAADMGAPSISDYWRSVEDFCRECRTRLKDSFVSLVVVGSLSVGDAIPGWSDVDAYLILESVTDEVRTKVAALVADVTRKFPWYATDRGSRFTVFPVSRGELRLGGPDVSFLSQWDLKRHGVVACGEDVTADLAVPELDRTWLDRNTEWMMQFLARDHDAALEWKARNAIGFVLAGARVAILKGGTYAKAKQEIARAFAQLHPERFSTVGRAMQCRGEWPRILNDPGAIDALYQEATGFLRWVRDLP